jgi:hypothetical protein
MPLYVGLFPIVFTIISEIIDWFFDVGCQCSDKAGAIELFSPNDEVLENCLTPAALTHQQVRFLYAPTHVAKCSVST